MKIELVAPYANEHIYSTSVLTMDFTVDISDTYWTLKCGHMAYYLTNLHDSTTTCDEMKCYDNPKKTIKDFMCTSKMCRCCGAIYLDPLTSKEDYERRKAKNTTRGKIVFHL